MTRLSTRQAAKKLGMGMSTLARYIAEKKLPAPEAVEAGSARVFAWSEEDIEKARKILPSLKNGRKTRYQKERAKKKSQSKGSKKASKKKASKKK
jgi:predicted DNA-binding transcriptional regulator AlpA